MKRLSFERTSIRKSMYNFNHISVKLSKEEIQYLRDLYSNYHKKYWCYKVKYKKLKKIKLCLNMSSLSLICIGTIVGGITANPIILGSITGSGVLLQGYIQNSNLNNKVDMCKFAYQCYEKVLIQLRSFLRGLEYNDTVFVSDLQLLDQIITDLCPTVSKLSDKYDKKFTSE